MTLSGLSVCSLRDTAPVFVPGKDLDVFGRRETVQVQIPAPALAGCVALGWPLNLSGRVSALVGW